MRALSSAVIPVNQSLSADAPCMRGACSGSNLATVEMIYKMKGSAGFTAVSDYSDRRGLAEAGDGSYTTPEGEPYTVWHGVAWNASNNVMSNGNDLYVGVKNLHSLGISLCDIAEMASAGPARAAGIFGDTGSISVGKAADLVLLDAQMKIQSVYIDGIQV